MIYVYACKDCNSQFELQMTLKERESLRVICPNCKSEKVMRIFTPPVVKFRGKGFYSTDNGVKQDE